ncbi:HAD family hydrolase [Streptomyces sp. NPDC058740]|uniref:HAD family hydrolase n=1 Tax=Streptomyces sp. NPDC058740 TaxID=3346619 RepID=UPI0036BCE164
MTDAALVLQEALNILVTGRRPVLHRGAQPPAALVQPVLPFHGRPARETPPVRADEVEDVVAAWANGRFEPVRADDVLLLAPVGPASAWRHAGIALGDLAARLLHRQHGATAYVGDTGSDVRHARAAGLRAIAVSYGYADIDDLARAGPDLVLHTPPASTLGADSSSPSTPPGQHRRLGVPGGRAAETVTSVLLQDRTFICATVRIR